ncbi:serine/threonine-protein kinase/endoribonuclease IRE1a isoform X2 [Mangifera indica]|uniref:serine/threonine-protein kinase/endoribonuclease IRE1a isoform X2 n=1 Tax=Mangifera indica TaxID=29780 RepID=UPI001CFBE5D2|nr:serine/threonine-protein kinase/endoribonuclease IRE1a isoform X2 [Mangifera indica]
MTHHFLRFFCLLFLFLFAVLSSESWASPFFNPVEDDSVDLVRPTGRSLLSLPNSQRVTRIGAALDGKISMRDDNGRVVWSFATGSPIYTSYQAPMNQDNTDKENASEPSSRFFIDCGDDWDLYAQGDLGRMKLPVSIEEFIKNTPYISEEGGVTLGSKKTTVFVVEAKTGRLVRIYRSSDSPSTQQSDEEESTSHKYDEVNKELLKSGLTNNAEPRLLFITRTDYMLDSFNPNSDKISWRMTVAEIGYAFLCPDIEDPFITATINTRYELGPEIGNDFDMPFACQSKGIVQRFRKHDNLSYAMAHHNDSVLPLPAPNLVLPFQPKVDGALDNHEKPKMLPAPAQEPMLPLQPEDDKLSRYYNIDESEAVRRLIPLKTKVSGKVDAYDVRMPYKGVSSIFLEHSAASITCVLIIVGFMIYRYDLVAKGQLLFHGHFLNSNLRIAALRIGASKRNKIQKSGKITASFQSNDRHMSSENEDEFAEDSNKLFMDLNKLVDGAVHGRRVGKLIVSNTEIAKGSNGTIVLEGIYEGRPVAVKRLVRAHHDVAFKEIQNLIASDRHPNIVRWYGVEDDQDFVYLSLERCTCSLADLIQICSHPSHDSGFSDEQASGAMIEYKLRLNSVKGMMQGLKLWKVNGHPSPLLLKLMRDMVSGLVHLHELGIIHRDLKPQNVLIVKERSLCAKLSDMGISKRLLGDMSSLGHHATGSGSSGWQAPEQLLHGRQTRAIDLFSLGCVLYFCITGGKHPFGDNLERDINITKNKLDLFLVRSIPEAEDLISSLLNPNPQLRPSALEVLHHPLFWNSETRLSFLRDTSDRVELEDRETYSNLLRALESIASVALGTKWNERMEPLFIANIGYYRRYRFDSVRDLLRVMRNKLNHYRELPKEIKELVGPVPEGFDEYFASRFPQLFIEVYKVVHRYCREEECFQKYFKSNTA